MLLLPVGDDEGLGKVTRRIWRYDRGKQKMHEHNIGIMEETIQSARRGIARNQRQKNKTFHISFTLQYSFNLA